jgi:hypothetical protein
MRRVVDHQVTADEARCDCALGPRPTAGHSFPGVHHVLACPLALTLITERNRLVGANPRADPPFGARVRICSDFVGAMPNRAICV